MPSDLDSSQYVLTISEDDAEDGRAMALLMERPGALGIQSLCGPSEDVAWFSLDLNDGSLAELVAFIEAFDWIDPVEVLLRVKATSGKADRYFSYDEIEGCWGWAPHS